ncbi:MAG: Nucleotidyltransferase substrate binding protein [Candidatus Nitrospira kreftii]|uniref:Nucleotidyltransferase substrate binding protein n=1 Tax=Candidatus Nitrospira kreftii TaxID=2652173 RepID=A0A7S8FD07_9BACT|nr:MAG: Nucleotidyltransferase substrate binding protein [Candidatus Nitrospira kreftii]
MSTRLDSFTTAITRFSEALSAPATDLTRDASIQRFEFCFELAWKVIQERARAEGLECQSPKSCLKMAYKNSWITDETGWLAMLEDRNRTAHTYDETLAKDVYRRLPAHLPILQALNAYLRSTQA